MSPARFTKAWVRENWDYDRNTAPKPVLLVKLVHEWHIAVPGIVAAVIVSLAYYSVGATDLEIVSAFFGTFGIAYGLFFTEWWCSVLSG